MAAWQNRSSYNQVFNLGIGHDCTINRLVDLILDSQDQSRENYQIDYQDERPGDQRNMRADIQKARSILGWQPSVDLHDGIKSTVAWAKDHG